MALREEPLFDVPIPGQGLTAELGSRPWQNPPQLSTVDEAIDYYVERLTEEIFVRMTWELRDDLTENTTQLDYIDNQTVSQGLTKTTKENDHVSI